MQSRLTRLVPASLRSLERLVHNAWLRLCVRVLARDGGPLPDWSVGSYRVLFVRYDRLGDMILSTGLLRAIANAHSNFTIDVLTAPSNRQALEGLPFLNDVIVHRRGQWSNLPLLLWRLSRRHYDVVIDGLVGRPSVNSYTAMVMLASRARWRIGSGDRPQDFVYNVPVTPPGARNAEHHVEHLARLAAPFGVAKEYVDWRPRLAPTSREVEVAAVQWGHAKGDGLRVLVNLSAGHPERRWPDARFAEVLRALRRREPLARIMVVAMHADAISAHMLAETVAGAVVIPTVRELVALVAAADLVISPDTAVTHIASAFRRPTLALLRRRQEYAAWVPYDTPGRNVFGDDEISLEALPASRVVGALESLLDERRAEAPRAPDRSWSRAPVWDDEAATAMPNVST
jgi:ADP-heptose:LPS heptosyltransferase